MIENIAEEKRETFIDIYKGILIIFVIIGHSPTCPSWLGQWIYSFHMPAFFAAYGLSYNIEKHMKRLELGGVINFLIQKSKRIVIPYVIFALIYCKLEPKNVLYVLYGSSQALTAAGSLSSLWYLTCMFVSVAIFELILYCSGKIHTKNKSFTILIVVVISIVAAFSFPKIDIGYPWEINVAFMAVGFIGIGLFLKFAIQRFRDNKWFAVVIVIIALLSFVVLTLTYRINMNYITISHASMAKAHYGNSLLYFCDALLGTIFVISLSIIFNKLSITRKILCGIGERSMGVYLTHKPILLVMVLILSKITSVSIIVFICGCILTLIFSLIVTELIRKFVPEIIGENRKLYS